MNRTRPSLFQRPAAVWLAGTMMCACAIMLCSDSLRSDEGGFATVKVFQQFPAHGEATPPSPVGRAAILSTPAERATHTSAPPGRASIADAWLAPAGFVEIGRATTIPTQERPAVHQGSDQRRVVSGFANQRSVDHGSTGDALAGRTSADKAAIIHVSGEQTFDPSHAIDRAGLANGRSHTLAVADAGTQWSAANKSTADVQTDASSANNAFTQNQATHSADAFEPPASPAGSRVHSTSPATLGFEPVAVAETPVIIEFSRPFTPPIISPGEPAVVSERDHAPQSGWRPYAASEANADESHPRGKAPESGGGTLPTPPLHETLSPVIIPGDFHTHSTHEFPPASRNGLRQLSTQPEVTPPATPQPASRWMPTDSKRRSNVLSYPATDGNSPRDLAVPAVRDAKPLPPISRSGANPAVVRDVSPASHRPRFAEPAAIGEIGATDVAADAPTGDGWVPATGPPPIRDAHEGPNTRVPAPGDVYRTGECTRHILSVPQSAAAGPDDLRTDVDGWKGRGKDRSEETHPRAAVGSEEAKSPFDPVHADSPNASIPAQPWRLAHVDPTPHVPKRSGNPHHLWERLGGPAVPHSVLAARRLPSLADQPLVLTRRTSPHGSERRANRFDSPRIASPQLIVKLRMEITPIEGVARVQSPRRLTFELRDASPEIRSPRRLTSGRNNAQAQIRSPRRTSFALRNASPEIRSPRKVTADSRELSRRTRSRRPADGESRDASRSAGSLPETSFVLHDASPEIRSPRETSPALRDASPRIRSPQKYTFIQTVSSEPTPANLTPADDGSSDEEANGKRSAGSETNSEASQQPAQGLKEDQKLGEAPEDTSLRFLRQQTVLLDPGEHQLDISIEYINDKFDFVALQQQNGGVQVAEAERRQRLLLVPLQLRYGISKYTQAFVNVPFGWANSETSFLGTDQASSSGGIGDVSAGLVKQVIVGNEYYPDVLATLSFSAPTGESKFLTALETPGSNLGEGFWSTSTAITFIQTYDPLVFFYGAGLRYRFEEKFDGGFKVDPGLQAFYQLGLGFAVTPHVTLSAAFNGAFISEFEVNGEDVGGSSQEPMQVRLAATISKRRPAKSESCLKVVEPFVIFGLNDDAIDTVLGITWTY